MSRVAALCVIAFAMVAAGVSAEAKPRKKAASAESRKKSKKAKAKPTKAPAVEKTVEPPAPATPADELAAKIDAIAEEPIPAEEAEDLLEWTIDAPGEPTSGELAHLRIRDPKAVGKAFPGLRHWIHPIVRAQVLGAMSPGGVFGAPRKGVPRSRGCGGHCGVDLHADRGRPIVAVAPGVLEVVDRRRSGGDGLSGRHVRIRHADGTITTYMHLDSVVDGIDVGDRVSAGQQLGTLGSTGVSSGVAHLHFELQIPAKKANGRGSTRWIDAAPFLRDSHVIRRAIRKRAAKPTS